MSGERQAVRGARLAVHGPHSVTDDVMIDMCFGALSEEQKRARLDALVADDG